MHGFRMSFLGAVLALFAVSPAWGLDDDTIDRWIGSMADLQEWGEQQDAAVREDLGPEEDDPTEIDFERMMAQAADEHAEIRSIIQRHGFSDGQEWAQVGGRIYNAFIAVKMQEASPQVEQQMEQTMRRIEEDPNLTEEQKQQMRRQMEQHMRGMTGMTGDVPEADVRAVQRKEAELNRLFDAD